MPSRSDPLATVEDHLARILSTVAPLPVSELPLMEALGLACAEDVVSTLRLPRFDNSAMDGYAVRRDDLAGASSDAPVELPVVGAIGAGQEGVTTLDAGTAAKIMTGAPVPAGADAVVPYEWTDRGTERVRVDATPEAGQHVRGAGEDVAAGDLLVPAGTVLSARHLGLLASVGRASVVVRPRPRVVIVSTGSELRAPGTRLTAPDAIYDGNSYLLAATVARIGGVPERVGIIPDAPAEFLDALYARLGGADAVITSGGVSMGDYDVVKEALAPLGTVWFGGLAMQPGKPQGFGLVGGGGDPATPIFTLPGNPVSSYISCEVFVRPALRTMMGLAPVSLPAVEARLTSAITSPPGRRQFLRGAYDPSSGTATATVAPVGGSGSHLVGDLAAADALIVVPEESTGIAAGESATVIRLEVEGR